MCKHRVFNECINLCIIQLVELFPLLSFENSRVNISTQLQLNAQITITECMMGSPSRNPLSHIWGMTPVPDVSQECLKSYIMCSKNPGVI